MKILGGEIAGTFKLPWLPTQLWAHLLLGHVEGHDSKIWGTSLGQQHWAEGLPFQTLILRVLDPLTKCLLSCMDPLITTQSTKWIPVLGALTKFLFRIHLPTYHSVMRFPQLISDDRPKSNVLSDDSGEGR